MPDELIVRERQYEVQIVLSASYGQIYREHIVPGLAFNLQAGARILGSGSVLRVVE